MIRKGQNKNTITIINSQLFIHSRQSHIFLSGSYYYTALISSNRSAYDTIAYNITLPTTCSLRNLTIYTDIQIATDHSITNL